MTDIIVGGLFDTRRGEVLAALKDVKSTNDLLDLKDLWYSFFKDVDHFFLSNLRDKIQLNVVGKQYTPALQRLTAEGKPYVDLELKLLTQSGTIEVIL